MIFYSFYQINTILAMSPLRMDLGKALIGTIHGKHGLFSECFLPHVWSQMMCEGNKAMATHFAQTNVSRSRATNRWAKPATTAIHVYVSHRWCLQHIYMNWSSTSNRGSLVSLRNGSYLGGVGYEAFCYQVH